MLKINILGAGLAGCECALYLAEKGYKVNIYEQKPHKYSPAHKDENFAELVCSNSLKSDRIDSAGGLLKAEMRLLGTHLLSVAETCRVAAGGALAVDRHKFAQNVTQLIKSSENITVHYEEVANINENDDETITIVATGPLTQGALATEISRITGGDRLYFHDAAAPIVKADSLDMSKIFAASRYGKGTPDYLNCPFDKPGYEEFYEELIKAQSADLHDFDKQEPSENNENGTKIKVYEGCMPIEVMAKRGADTIRYGPLRPVGLVNPNTGHRPWANVQLRAENAECTMYNIVGFQTNLKFAEQKRVFSMIPGLENADFVRYGVMHRNTFINSPSVLNKNLSLKKNEKIFFAGQITGFEGYMESAASGLLAARAVHSFMQGEKLPEYPQTTMCGALLNYIMAENVDFQPMGANMGLLPPLAETVKNKRLRYKLIAQRALEDLIKTANVENGEEILQQIFAEDTEEDIKNSQ